MLNKNMTLRVHNSKPRSLISLVRFFVVVIYSVSIQQSWRNFFWSCKNEGYLVVVGHWCWKPRLVQPTVCGTTLCGA